MSPRGDVAGTRVMGSAEHQRERHCTVTLSTTAHLCVQCAMSLATPIQNLNPRLDTAPGHVLLSHVSGFVTLLLAFGNLFPGRPHGAPLAAGRRRSPRCPRQLGFSASVTDATHAPHHVSQSTTGQMRAVPHGLGNGNDASVFTQPACPGHQGDAHLETSLRGTAVQLPAPQA